MSEVMHTAPTATETYFLNITKIYWLLEKGVQVANVWALDYRKCVMNVLE